MDDKIKNIIKCVAPSTYKKIDKSEDFIINTLYRWLEKSMPKTMLDFEVQLTEDCNLNCKCCSHFSPLAKREDLDSKEYEKDCKRLSELFDGEAYLIRLMGGEPLLNSNICSFFDITRKYFPNTRIDLDTNGILVLQMKKDFWKSMHKNNINLTVTKYPIKIDYDKLIEKCNKEKVKFQFFDNEPNRTFNLFPLDLDGNQPIENNFLSCCLANTCHTLKHGKMYTCSTIPHISHFNKYFNCNINVSKHDYIDIYKAKTAGEIMEFLAKPVPFCRYCDVNNRIYGNQWQPSKKEITEWTYKNK